MVLGGLVASEGWAVVSQSLARVVEANPSATELRGMSNQAVHERHLLTAVLMPLVGVFKPYALNSYSGTSLGALSGRRRPYSADEMEHVLLSYVRLGWTEPLSVDVARWASLLWASDHDHDPTQPVYFYWDWHVKVVYSDYHIPRTKHGLSQRIVGARKQLLLHDGDGHLLFMSTLRGDTHLIDGMVAGTAIYEEEVQIQQLTNQIFDREGLSVVHFKTMAGEQRHWITCLRSNQYEGLDSFQEPTSFRPFRYNPQGQVIQEIAEATYEMQDRRPAAANLELRAVLLRDALPSKVSGEERADETHPAEEEKTHVQAIITSDGRPTAEKIAELYRARQSKQENAIRDWWLPLGGDVNVGYAKHPVENSELAKRKEKLEMQLERMEECIPASQVRLEQTQQRHQKQVERYQTEAERARQSFEQSFAQHAPLGQSGRELYEWAKNEEARVAEALEPRCLAMERAAKKMTQAQEKQQRQCEEQQHKQADLVEVKQAIEEQPMYELDDRKDQLMSALRLLLVNVLQWLCRWVFPPSYAHATYETLKSFVQMGGYVREHARYIEIWLDGFWQSAKQHDLEQVVARCNELQLTAPDGRRLRFGICLKPGHI